MSTDILESRWKDSEMPDFQLNDAREAIDSLLVLRITERYRRAMMAHLWATVTAVTRDVSRMITCGEFRCPSSLLISLMAWVVSFVKISNSYDDSQTRINTFAKLREPELAELLSQIMDAMDPDDHETLSALEAIATHAKNGTIYLP